MRWMLPALVLFVAFQGTPTLGQPPAAEHPLNPDTGIAVPKINNGILTAAFPPVALYRGRYNVCTATLIGCRTAVTAAHCVCDSGPPCTPSLDGFLFFQNSGGYSVTGATVHPDWAPQLGHGRHDLAVLKLASPVAGVRPATLNLVGKPPAGTAASLVGFGTTSTLPPGIKRFGQVKLSTCSDSNASGLCYRFESPLGAPGEDSTGCPGDSGGPMFVATPSTVVLAGVTSGGLGPGAADCTAPVEGVYSDVFTDRGWIQSQAGSDLGQLACGGLPSAGTTSAPFASGDGSLDGTHSNAVFTLEVPDNVQLLLVTLNGEQTAGNDFDLYAQRGSVATAADYDCGSELSGTLELCIVVNPDPGTWYLAAKRYSGDGLFQVTATSYLRPQQTAPCEPDANTLCIDDQPGDRRFRIQVSFAAPGEVPRAAMAIPLSSLGVGRGGLLTFFNPANPEMLIKVLNGCPVNQHHWVFYAATTNVELMVTVTDTVTGQVWSRSNPQGTAAVPVQDTGAFPCN